MYWNSISAGVLWADVWLTLTWDVLKFLDVCMESNLDIRLTLTWDVLKFFIFEDIEKLDLRLTLTWDVLKWIFYRFV